MAKVNEFSHCCPDVFVQPLYNYLITNTNLAIIGVTDLKRKNQFQMMFVPICTTGGKYHACGETSFLTARFPWHVFRRCVQRITAAVTTFEF